MCVNNYNMTIQLNNHTHFAARVLIVPVPIIRIAIAIWKTSIPGLLIKPIMNIYSRERERGTWEKGEREG